MMTTGLYGAGQLGRYIGSLLQAPFVFVDDTPEKQGTKIDGAPVLSMREYAEQMNGGRLYSCIMQDGYDYFERRDMVKRKYNLPLLPFPPLLLSLNGSWHFYEPPASLAQKMPRYDYLMRHLADDDSVACLRGHLKLRAEGDLSALALTPLNQQGFLMRRLPDNINYVDIGAYDGDTIENFIKQRGGRFNHIWAVEPDAGNRARLLQRLAARLGDKLTVLPHAISAAGGHALKFSQTGAMHSKLSDTGGQTVSVSTLEQLGIQSPALYKIDIEGDDLNVVLSSLDYMRRERPHMELSAYHHFDDLLLMFEAINELAVGYRFYLRCYSNDGFDLDLFCIPSASGAG